MNTTLIKNKWKARLVEGKAEVVLPIEEFNKHDHHFLITMCANPQHIVEFPAYNEESAKRIAEFMAKELKDHYPHMVFNIEAIILTGANYIPVTYDGTNYRWVPPKENTDETEEKETTTGEERAYRRGDQ